MNDNLEIEYKILINKIPDIVKNNIKPIQIEQFYFDFENSSNIITNLFDFDLSNEGYIYRIRKTIDQFNNVKYVLCIKSIGFIHKEYEKIINEQIYNQIKSNKIYSLIIKNRYVDKINLHNYEFDEFLNLNKDLNICEVEIQNNNIDIKTVINTLKEHYKLDNVIDVTNNKDYLNVNLVKTFGYKI